MSQKAIDTVIKINIFFSRIDRNSDRREGEITKFKYCDRILDL